MKQLLIGVSVFVLTLAVAGVLSAQSDRRIGTWKLNVAKSSGAAPRKSETRTYEASGDTITMHSEVVNSDGSKQAYGVTEKTDGKDNPFTGQPPGGAETTSVKRVGKTFISENKKGGKLLFTARETLSNDGKVMTFTTKGTDANGQPVSSVRVYEKQ